MKKLSVLTAGILLSFGATSVYAYGYQNSDNNVKPNASAVIVHNDHQTQQQAMRDQAQHEQQANEQADANQQDGDNMAQHEMHSNMPSHANTNEYDAGAAKQAEDANQRNANTAIKQADNTIAHDNAAQPAMVDNTAGAQNANSSSNGDTAE